MFGLTKEIYIFLDAPGGTGKNLFTLISAKVRSQVKLALAVASSDIAVTLLAGGRTAHPNLIWLLLFLYIKIACALFVKMALW